MLLVLSVIVVLALVVFCGSSSILDTFSKLKVTMWTLLLLTLLAGIIAASSETTTPKKLKQKKLTTPKPVLFVTPSTLIDEEVTTKQPITQKPRKHFNENKNVPTTEATRRSDHPPIRFTFPPNRNDQLRLQTKNSYRRPSKAAPDPVLSSSRDTTLTHPDQAENSPLPATYESIVYNPDSNDASSAFSSSNFWETPELIIRDTKQRQEGKNTLITTNSRVEYTPNLYSSVQTPLNQIWYRGNKQPIVSSPSRTEQYRKPTEQTTPQVVENTVDEDEEEESQNQEVEEENEELTEVEEDEEEGRRRPTYPVNLNTRTFSPYENVQEPDDIYGDVLNNIGSVFSDEHSSLPIEGHNYKETKAQTPSQPNNLLPQFEQYSFENLQQQERNSEDNNDDDGEYVEDNQELAEYDEDDEGGETKQVPLQKVTESPKPRPSPLNSVYRSNPINHQQKKETGLKESPFPSVKIIQTHKDSAPKEQKTVTYRPWLPIQQPTQGSKPTPWPKTTQQPYRQTWQQPAYKNRKETPRPHQWENTKHQNTPESDHKPYQESYKTSYNKSWKSSSPKKDDNSSYKTSWEEVQPDTHKHKNYKKEQKFASSEQKPVKKNKTKKKTSRPTSEVIRRSDSVPEDTNNSEETNPIFVTPVTPKLTSGDNVADPSGLGNQTLGEESAVNQIDQHYEQQHRQL